MVVIETNRYTVNKRYATVKAVAELNKKAYIHIEWKET
jgi:hypothetical protein